MAFAVVGLVGSAVVLVGLVIIIRDHMKLEGKVQKEWKIMQTELKKTPENKHRRAFESHEAANLQTPELGQYVPMLSGRQEVRWGNTEASMKASAQIADVVSVRLQSRQGQIMLTMTDVDGKQSTLWCLGTIPLKEHWYGDRFKVRAFTDC